MSNIDLINKTIFPMAYRPSSGFSNLLTRQTKYSYFVTSSSEFTVKQQVSLVPRRDDAHVAC